MTFLDWRRALHRRPWVVLAGALILPLSACDIDRITEVRDPSRLTDAEAATAEAVPALVRGATRQFFGGYSGFGLDDSFLSMSGVISDELYYGDTFTTRAAADRRALQVPVLGNISDPAFSRLHQARLNARRAYAASAQFFPDDTATLAQMRAIEGYTYVTLSEGWCGAVPFSTVPDTGIVSARRIVPGRPLTTVQMNDSAVHRFNQALAHNSANRLAKLGKARALLNLGRYADAAAAVATVPTTWVYHIEHSTNSGSQNNPMFSLMSNGRYGISNDEGGTLESGVAKRSDLSPTSADFPVDNGNGIAFRALRDPRVPWDARPPRGVCFSSSISCWRDLNYPDLGSDVPLASGIEARLVEAEASLFAGGTAWLTILNDLRAEVGSLVALLHPGGRQTFPAPPAAPSLAPLTDPGTPAARRALLFQERALWLFNTGHRQGDLRRLIRNYGLPQDQVFPAGPYFRGGSYGTDVSYPLPFAEQGNEHFEHSMCVTSEA